MLLAVLALGVCAAYARYILYSLRGGKLYQIAVQTQGLRPYPALAGHVLGIWTTYAIRSHAVAYLSKGPLIGPRLPSIRRAYARHTPNSPRLT